MRNPYAQHAGAEPGRRAWRRVGALVLPAVLALSVAPLPAVAVPLGALPDSASVEVLGANGAGCATMDSVTAGLSPDFQDLRITYHAFRAQSGAGASAVDYRKACLLSLQVHHPPEFTFAIIQHDLTGRARAATGASASVRSGWYRQGTAQGAPSGETMTGPMEGDWRVTIQVDIGPVMEPCGQNRPLRLLTELRVPAGTSDPAEGNYITMADGVDGPNSTYRLAWGACPAAAP